MPSLTKATGYWSPFAPDITTPSAPRQCRLAVAVFFPCMKCAPDLKKILVSTHYLWENGPSENRTRSLLLAKQASFHSTIGPCTMCMRVYALILWEETLKNRSFIYRARSEERRVG